jgi:hypothetical protein
MSTPTSNFAPVPNRCQRFPLGESQKIMSMNKSKIKWVLLTLVVILGLGLIAKPLPRQKARAQRIQTVNTVNTVNIRTDDSLNKR